MVVQFEMQIQMTWYEKKNQANSLLQGTLDGI